jgi:hypothetical protein
MDIAMLDHYEIMSERSLSPLLNTERRHEAAGTGKRAVALAVG